MKTIRMLAGLAAATCLATAQADTFRWVSMPDAQNYADDFAHTDGALYTDRRGTAAIYDDIVTWIIAQQGNPATEIHYVQQLGDLVQNGDNLTEWAIAETAMDKLEAAGIIYGAAEGNHDCAFGVDDCRDSLGPGSYHANYLTYFGPSSSYGASTMAAQPWYASSPSGASNAQFIQFDGRKLGFINLSIGNPQAELDWARALIAAEPDRIFIVGAHMLNYDGAFLSGRETEVLGVPLLGLPPIPFFPRTFEPYPLYIEGNTVNPLAPDLAAELADYTSSGEFGNFGQNVYEELTTQYPNVLLLHSGHNCGENLRTDGVNGDSNPVIEILTDYQCTINGGDGWTRVYEFDFDTNTLTWTTVSPRVGLTSDPDIGVRPALGSTVFTSTDTTGISRTPMDSFVDYLDFLEGFVLPTAIASFPGAVEAFGVSIGIYSQPQFDQFKADDLANGTMTYQEALEQVLLALLGNDLTGASGFLFAHPDFDEAAEQAYYTNKLRLLLGGAFPTTSDPVTFPRGWSNIAAFEGVWINFFSEDETGASGSLPTLLSCNDPTTGGGVNKFARCPSGALAVDFSLYAAPAAPTSPARLPTLPLAFSGLFAFALAALAYRRAGRAS